MIFTAAPNYALCSRPTSLGSPVLKTHARATDDSSFSGRIISRIYFANSLACVRAIGLSLPSKCWSSFLYDCMRCQHSFQITLRFSISGGKSRLNLSTEYVTRSLSQALVRPGAGMALPTTLKEIKFGSSSSMGSRSSGASCRRSKVGSVAREVPARKGK